jgi:putative redox protein
MAEQLEVTATWLGGWQTDVRAREHGVRVDEPASVGGDDTGMMPTELFCAAMASCFCLAVGYAARKRDIELPGLTVVVRARRAGRELRYESLDVEVQAEADDETLARLVERAKPLCWVSNSLAAGIAVEYRHTSLDGHFRK